MIANEGATPRARRADAGFALRFAWRELRAGVAGFRIFLMSLVLGVGAVAAVGSLGEGVSHGIAERGRTLLGGDVSLRLTHRTATAEQEAFLAREGKVSRIAALRAMARSENHEARLLIELKAVDAAYPLFGDLVLDGTNPTDAFAVRDGVPGAAVEDGLLRRLGLPLGARIQLGDRVFDIRARIISEPDRGVSGGIFGPRVMISMDALAGTGLVQPGSMVRYFYRLALPAGVDPVGWAENLDVRFPDAWWRAETTADALPGVSFFIDRLAQFLTLVGLAALLIGGVGVANAVRAYLATKRETIATLKCLGATRGTVFRIYLAEVLIMAACATGLGLALGVMAPYAAVWFADKIPVPIAAGVYPAPLALAALFGFLTTVAFTVQPLAEAASVKPARLFRGAVEPQADPAAAGGIRSARFYAGLAVLTLAALAVTVSVDRLTAFYFVAGAAATFLGFGLAARAVVVLARTASDRPGPWQRPWLRLAIANLHRPGTPTGSVVLSLGLGITVLVAVALIESNLASEIEERMPRDAPSFYFIDIQPAQLDRLKEIVAATPGAGGLETVANVRGRIVALNGVPVEELAVDPDVAWVTRGDRGVTTAARPPEGVKIVDGAWWDEDYGGEPLVSFDAEAARGMGARIGDTVTVNILGREIKATIWNLRRIDWRTLQLNYVMVFSPGVLEGAPYTYVATVHAPPPIEDRLERDITDALVNVTAIRVRDALQAADRIMRDVALAVRLTAAVALAAGLLVLAGAIASGHQRRVYDAVVLKVLGARRAAILAGFLVEFLLIGAATAAIAGLAGTAAAFAIVTGLMETTWQFAPLPLISVLTGAVALTAAAGFAGTWRALGARPAALLRNP